MIEKTEFGVLISYEEWEMLQEKLNCTTSNNEEVSELKKENESLKDVLRQMNSFLTAEVEP